MLTAGSTSVRDVRGRSAPGRARRRGCCCARRRRGAGASTGRPAAPRPGFVVHGKRSAALRRPGRGGGRRDRCPTDVPLRGGDGQPAATASRCRGSTCRPRSTARPISPATSACPTWSSPRSARGRSATRKLVRVDRAAADAIRGRGRGRSTIRLGRGGRRTIGGRRTGRSTRSRPRFATKGPIVNSRHRSTRRSIAALDGDGRADGGGRAICAAVFKGARLVTAEYRVGLAVHAAIETMTATAQLRMTGGSNCGCRPRRRASPAPRPRAAIGHRRKTASSSIRC